MDKENKRKLEDFVSPSDIPLFDIVACNLDAIEHTIKIFGDRNTSEALVSFVLGVLQSSIYSVTGVKVNAQDLMEFIVNQEKSNDKK